MGSLARHVQLRSNSVARSCRTRSGRCHNRRVTSVVTKAHFALAIALEPLLADIHRLRENHQLFGLRAANAIPVTVDVALRHFDSIRSADSGATLCKFGLRSPSQFHPILQTGSKGVSLRIVICFDHQVAVSVSGPSGRSKLVIVDLVCVQLHVLPSFRCLFWCGELPPHFMSDRSAIAISTSQRA